MAGETDWVRSIYAVVREANQRPLRSSLKPQRSVTLPAKSVILDTLDTVEGRASLDDAETTAMVLRR
jgi:hypothetical protein